MTNNELLNQKKAEAYDLIGLIEQAQRRLQQTNQEILQLAQAAQQPQVTEKPDTPPMPDEQVSAASV
ncbi:MAG: hypothetical protein ABI539_01165 [Acidobacteriota bacterium]